MSFSNSNNRNRAIRSAVKIIIMFAAGSYLAVPQYAYAVDVTDSKDYAQSLLGGGDTSDTNQWVQETIQNNGVTGYEAPQYNNIKDMLAVAQTGCRYIYEAFLGTIILLFIVKIVGRAIIEMMTRDEETVETIPMFFQTAKERSNIKEPSIMKTRGSWIGGGLTGGGGKPMSQLQRNYTGPSYISQHPYIEFIKEFIVFMLISFAAFVAIECIMSFIGLLIGGMQNTDGGTIFNIHAMFGL